LSQTTQIPGANGSDGNRYQITAPAFYAAGVIWRNFTVDRSPGQTLEPCCENLAILIDHATRLPQTLPVLHRFVADNPWYVPHERLDPLLDWLGETPLTPKHRVEDHLERLRHGIRQLEMATEEMKRLHPRGSKEGPGLPCGAAWYAARLMTKFFDFKPTGRVRFSQRNVALIVDTCTETFRLQAAVDTIIERSDWLNSQMLARRVKTVRKALRVLEVVRDRMPSRGIGAGFILREVKRLEEKPDPHPDFPYLQRRLDAAENARQEQKILREWKEHIKRNVVEKRQRRFA
jgi:hypothetical protein